MGRINVRSKGANGEREFCRWLQDTLDLGELPERNLDQVRNGGADIMTLPQFTIEVKRCEALALRQWWVQVMQAATKDSQPIVAYRQNRKPWKFLISAQNIGLDKGFIEIAEFEFKKWITRIYSENK